MVLSFALTSLKTTSRFKLGASEYGEDRCWWKVVHEPNEDSRELSKRDGRREIVDSSDNVSFKIRG